MASELPPRGGHTALPVGMRLAACALVLASLFGCTPAPKVPRTASVTSARPCVPAGTWVVPATGQHLTAPEVVTMAAARRIVLRETDFTRALKSSLEQRLAGDFGIVHLRFQRQTDILS